MDWWRAMVWVLRGRGWWVGGFVAWLALVYAHVPLVAPDPAGRTALSAQGSVR